MKLGFFRGFFTGPDNATGEIGRVNWTVSIVSLIGCQAYAIYKGQTFEAGAFGIALAAVLSGGGWGIGKKDQAADAAARGEVP